MALNDILLQQGIFEVISRNVKHCPNLQYWHFMNKWELNSLSLLFAFFIISGEHSKERQRRLRGKGRVFECR